MYFRLLGLKHSARYNVIRSLSDEQLTDMINHGNSIQSSGFGHTSWHIALNRLLKNEAKRRETLAYDDEYLFD